MQELPVLVRRTARVSAWGLPAIGVLRAERHGEVTFGRVRRGEEVLFAEPDTTLELGDRVRVVAPRDRLADVSRAFGDSYRALGEIDGLTFAVGIAIGLAIGAVKIPTGGGGHFELGFAGGPLVVGLVLGALGRTGPLVWELPYQANLTLRQLGTVLFPAGVGTKAGGAFAQTITDTRALRVLGTGLLSTVIALAIALIVGSKLFKLPPRALAGVIAGLQTQPAVLAFASEQSPDDREVNLGYATVYPVAMIAKIVVAQLIVSFTT